MEYTVYSGEIPVAQVSSTRIITLNEKLAPLCFRDNRGSLEEWIRMRVIDSHRTNSRLLKRILRMKSASDEEAFLRFHGATITDNYWVKAAGENITWEDVRFQENYFDRLTLIGDFASYSREFTDRELTTPTPELTNPGSYEKCWRLEGGRWYLYKAGTPEELFSEIFISRLGRHLGFQMAEYKLSEGRFVKTPDFTEGRLNFEPAATLAYENEDVEFHYDLAKRFSNEMAQQYLDILFMDALVMNMDRHTLNFGYLRSQETGEVISMAPNYDNNIALISRGYPKDPGNTSRFLINEFHDLLAKVGANFHYPVLEKNVLREIAMQTAPELEIRREITAEFVWENYLALKGGKS